MLETEIIFKQMVLPDIEQNQNKKTAVPKLVIRQIDMFEIFYKLNFSILSILKDKNN